MVVVFCRALAILCICHFPRCNLLRLGSMSRLIAVFCSGLLCVPTKRRARCHALLSPPYVITAAHPVGRAPPPLLKKRLFLVSPPAPGVYFKGGLLRPPTDPHHCKISVHTNIMEYPHVHELRTNVAYSKP